MAGKLKRFNLKPKIRSGMLSLRWMESDDEAADNAAVHSIVRWLRTTSRLLNDFQWLGRWETQTMMEMVQWYERRLCLALIFCHRDAFMLHNVPHALVYGKTNVLSGHVHMNISYDAGFCTKKERGECTELLAARGPCGWTSLFSWDRNFRGGRGGIVPGRPRVVYTCVADECIEADKQLYFLENNTNLHNMKEYLPDREHSAVDVNLGLLETYFVCEFEMNVAQQLDNALCELDIIACFLKRHYAASVLPKLLSRAHRSLSGDRVGRQSGIDLPHVVDNIMWHVALAEVMHDSEFASEEKDEIRKWISNLKDMRSTTAHWMCSQVVTHSQSSSWFCVSCSRKCKAFLQESERQCFPEHMSRFLGEDLGVANWNNSPYF